MANRLIPNTFQHPNSYIDWLSHYLTPQEEKVLNKAIREILGWHDKIESRRARIALSIFTEGKKDRNGKTLCLGCGLSTGAVRKALEALNEFSILCKVGKATQDGQEFYLQETWDAIDFDGLEERLSKKNKGNAERTTVARQARGVMSDNSQVCSETTAKPVVPQQQRNPIRNPKETLGVAESIPIPEIVEWKIEDPIEVEFRCTNPNCDEVIVIADLDNVGAECPHCHLPVRVRNDRNKVVKKPSQKARRRESFDGNLERFDDKPLRAFCAVYNVPYDGLTPKKKKQWAYQIQKVAEENDADSALTYKAIRAIMDSEHSWQSFKSPYARGFEELLSVMLLRIRDNGAAGRSPATTTQDAIKGTEYTADEMERIKQWASKLTD